MVIAQLWLYKLGSTISGDTFLAEICVATDLTVPMNFKILQDSDIFLVDLQQCLLICWYVYFLEQLSVDVADLNVFFFPVLY